jgi:hypothetical protein
MKKNNVYIAEKWFMFKKKNFISLFVLIILFLVNIVNKNTPEIKLNFTNIFVIKELFPVKSALNK